MKTLERFWHWHDNELPETSRALKLGNQELSPTARYALDLAATVIDCHQDSRQSLGCRFCTGDILERFPGALRTLSLAICAALEVMEAEVPRGEPVKPWVPLEPETPWWKPGSDAADALLCATTGVSEMHRAARKETLDRYAGMFEGTPAIELLREQNRVLGEIDRAERLRPQGVIYDPDRVIDPSAYAHLVEAFDPLMDPPTPVLFRCVRSEEARAELAAGAKLLGPFECKECLSKPCRYSQGGWPEANAGCPDPGTVVRPEARERAYVEFDITPAVDMGVCNSLRGASAPFAVRLTGRAGEYDPVVLRYLLIDILDPGHIPTNYQDPMFGTLWDGWRAI